MPAWVSFEFYHFLTPLKHASRCTVDSKWLLHVVVNECVNMCENVCVNGALPWTRIPSHPIHAQCAQDKQWIFYNLKTWLLKMNEGLHS